MKAVNKALKQPKKLRFPGGWYRGKSAYYDFVYKGKRYVGCIGNVTPSIAKEFVARKKSEVIQQRLLGIEPKNTQRITLEQYITNKYLPWYKSTRKKSSSYRAEWRCKQFVKIWGSLPLSSISSEIVENYRTSLLNLKHSNSYINRNFAILQHIYSTGMEWGYVKSNPLHKVKLTNTNNYRLRFLTMPEEVELLKVSSVDLQRVIIFAVYTGFRQGEICQLTWNDVDFDRREVKVQAAYSKTNSSRAVPMNNKVFALLSSMRENHFDNASSANLVFRWTYANVSNLRKVFRESTHQANIQDFRFHDLRHTFASRLVMAGVDIRTVQELMGHTLISMTMRYSHLSAEHKQKAVELLD